MPRLRTSTNTSGLSYAVKPGGLSEQDHERIFSLAEKGMKCGPIARAIEKHPATVRWFMYRNGLVEPGRLKAGLTAKPNSAGAKRYSAEEDAFIIGLRADGVHLAEIAKRATQRFGHPRSRHGIEVRLVMLAASEDDVAEAA